MNLVKAIHRWEGGRYRVPRSLRFSLSCPRLGMQNHDIMSIRGTKHAACRLCGKTSSLCRSHVVPEFCYAYESSGSSRHGLELLVPPERGSVRTRKIQKGYREYLFCSACEGRFCRYERVFAGFWQNNVLSEAPFPIGQLLTFKHADYHATKLLILSVFWRASVSELFGQAVQLGPYSEKLRHILLGDRNVVPDHYPILGTLILDSDGMPFHGCVTQPVPTRYEQATGYTMCFAGCHWRIIISDHWVPKRLDVMKRMLDVDGSLRLMTDHFSGIPFLRRMAVRLRADG